MSEFLYSKTHEWVKREDDETVLVGLSEHAVNEMGDLVFINLPEPGSEVTAGEVMADVESVKAVSDIYSPVTGTVEEVNEELSDAPEKINQDPEGTWIARISSADMPDDLMDEEGYEKYLSEL